MSENSEKPANRGKHAGKEEYGASDIKRLKGLKAVRERERSLGKVIAYRYVR